MQWDLYDAMQMLPTPFRFLEHALWSFEHSMVFMFDILTVEQPLYHPVPYDLALFHHFKIFFVRKEGLVPCGHKQTLNAWVYFSFCRSGFCRQERPKSFPWLRLLCMNLNWKLISFKISLDEMKGSFFVFRTIAWITTSVVFLTRGFSFFFFATLLCLLWRKCSRYN